MVLAANRSDSILPSAGNNERKVVLIVSDSLSRSRPIQNYLSQSNFLPIVAEYNGKVLRDIPRQPPQAVLIDMRDHYTSVPKIIQTLKDRFAPHETPFVGTISDEEAIDDTLFDSAIFQPSHPAQIATRVNSLIRLSKMQREICLRIETLQEDFGVKYDLEAEKFEHSFRVLFIGKASPDFMVVINALEEKNVEVVAAFTSFSAFDFLHEVKFDAVVMNMLNGPEPALTITETMRRNSRLYHVPTLYLTGEDFDLHDKAYAFGATDIIPFGSVGEEISGRILELANYHRVHVQLKEKFSAIGGSRCIDDASGTFNQAFFFAHMRRVNAANIEQGTPTAIMLVRILPALGGVDAVNVTAACDRAGRMIKNMIRMEDIIARLDDFTYAIGFPGQSEASVQVVSDRISGIMSDAAFETGNLGREIFQMDLDIRVSDVSTARNTDQVISTLLSKLKPVNLRLTG
jgi:two-component system cell cycle response regulator PopA